MGGGKIVDSLADLPEGTSWAILEQDSIYVPGDERSRTNPGHGYPAHTKNFVRIYAFDSMADFKATLRKLHEKPGRRTFKAFELKSVRVKTKLVIDIGFE